MVTFSRRLKELPITKYQRFGVLSLEIGICFNMEQHPVPQHIASFEFKLFGNLTIRQFVNLAIPASIGGIIFFSGLPDIVRFPLSGLFVGFGLLIALVPFGGRAFP